MNARPTPRTLVAVLTLVALPLLLAGCGNKGPLILPPKDIPVDPSTVPATPPPSATPEAEATPPVDAATPAQPPTDEPDDDGRRR